MWTFTIYALHDPRDGLARYVGVTSDPCVRLRSHLSSARSAEAYSKLATDARAAWICELARAGLAPTLDVLEVVEAERHHGAPNQAERRWMARLLAQGHPLLNAKLPRPSARAALRARVA